MLAWTYILECVDGRHYTGCTGDLSRRLDEHREGRVRWTSWRLPVRLVYFEECQRWALARQRELSLKNGRTRRKKIEEMIRRFPPEKLAPFA